MSDVPPVTCRGDWFPRGKTVVVTEEEARAVRMALVYFFDNPLHSTRAADDGVDTRELQRKFK